MIYQVLFSLCVLLFNYGDVNAQMVVQPPAWPIYWQAYYIQINTSYPSDLHSAGGWWSDFTKYPSQPGLLRQDLNYGCNGGPFTGSCRGIFSDNNFYQYSPADNICCVAFKDLPPTPPDWLVNISTETGTAVYEWNGQVSTTWQFLEVKYIFIIIYMNIYEYILLL